MIEYEKRGDAAWIRLNRPEKMNALTIEGWHQLQEALNRASKEARAAVLTGTGDVFCAGDDVEVLESIDSAQELEELADALYDVIFGIETLQIPVIAAVNGLTYGGACEMLIAADLAVTVDDAQIALPETRIGVYPVYAVKRVMAMATRKRAMELILTGEPIDAQTAKEWGMVNNVVDEDELESAVEKYVDSICRSPKRSVTVAKRYANNHIAQQGEQESIAGGFAHLFLDDETQEGLQAFVEDRTPSYQQ